MYTVKNLFHIFGAVGLTVCFLPSRRLLHISNLHVVYAIG